MLVQEIDITGFSREGGTSEERGVEELKRALITYFEEAIDQGVPPHIALAAILNFAAEESARLFHVAQ